ncbi:MAG: hypothetical protein KF778_13920 [Rhodocyclaceae bacterium]|nr:hypothetical protein [Rhodocyclaceae bacterium]MBX3669491.1 hypothetical protein [Rhodocyclaceae bacterium]
MASAFKTGWVALPTVGEVHLVNGIPDRVWVPDIRTTDDRALRSDVRDLTDLHVTLGPWRPGEGVNEREAAVHVEAEDFGEVLRHLAHASAMTFFDRYHHRIDDSATDFDDESYARDFAVALSRCGLRRNEIDQSVFREDYCMALHAAAADIDLHPEAA